MVAESAAFVAAVCASVFAEVATTAELAEADALSPALPADVDACEAEVAAALADVFEASRALSAATRETLAADAELLAAVA